MKGKGQASNGGIAQFDPAIRTSVWQWALRSGKFLFCSQVTTYLFRGASRQAELSRELERSHVHFGGLAPVERPGFAILSAHLCSAVIAISANKH